MFLVIFGCSTLLNTFQNVDYLTRVIGYMKRISNFSQARQKEAAQRYYAPLR